MFFFNALQFWKNIGDNDFVVDLKKFGRNYFDCIISKFTPASLKQTEYSSFYSCDFKSYVILSFIKLLVSFYFSILIVCNWNYCNPVSWGQKGEYSLDCNCARYGNKDLLTYLLNFVSESPGGIFAATAHLGPRFSCFLPILFTSSTCKNSHGKLIAHGKIKSGRESLVKKT